MQGKGDKVKRNYNYTLHVGTLRAASANKKMLMSLSTDGNEISSIIVF